MDPAIGVAALALAFVATHVGLAADAARRRLVPRLGERGFVAAYSAVATIGFAAVVGYYAAHRGAGAPNPAAVLAGAWLPRALLEAAVLAGIALATAGLAAYPRLPVALFGQAIRAPYGIERVTRHPFFAGTAMVGVAHAVLAPRLAGALLMAALAVLALVGARHQDARHLRARGAPYADYLAATSTLPFAAIVGGRQPLVGRELPWAALAAGVAVATVLRLAHASLFAAGGLWIVLAVIGGAVVASVQSWRRAHRRPSLADHAPVQPAQLRVGGAAAPPSRSGPDGAAVRS